MKTDTISLDEMTSKLQNYIEKELGVKVDVNKFKGVAYTALKEAGKLSEKDRFKSYDHVSRIQNTLNSPFKELDEMENPEDLFTFEDIESFTGNLFYTMRLATKRALDEITRLTQVYQGQETLDAKTVVNDLYLLKNSTKENINETWAYYEKTQTMGVNIFVTKILNFIRRNYYIRSPKK